MQAGDVESNPGPDPKTGAGAGAGLGAGSLRQTRLSTCAEKTAGKGGGAPPGLSHSPAPRDPSLADLLAKLNSMDSCMNEKLDGIDRRLNEKLDGVKDDVSEIKEQFGTLQKEVEEVKRQVDDLYQENQELRGQRDELLQRMEKLERKTDDLEGRSKRQNLVFFGMKRMPGETNVSNEQRLQELFTDKLELSDDVPMDRVHRVSDSPNSPLIARCTFYKDKIKILKAKKKLKGTNIFIGEDYSVGMREVRKKLSVIMKAKKAAGQTVTMVYDHLYIGEKKYTLGRDGETLVEVRKEEGR